MELELLAVADDRVAGVVTALEAHDRVGALGKQVGDLALALIAPLGAHYHHSWHDRGIVTVAGDVRVAPSGATRSHGRPRAAPTS